MIKLLRTAIFSSIVLGALGLLTYLIYFAPGQLQSRAARSLERYVTVPTAISGAQKGWMGPLTIDRIQIPSAPVIDQRDFLLLFGIEVEDAGGDPFSVRAPVVAPPMGSTIHIQRAKLHLDHDALADSSGALFSIAQWNWRDLFHDESLMVAARDASRAGHRLEVGELELEVQEIRRRQEKSSWSAKVEDLSIEGVGEGVLEVRGDLPPSAYWSEGQFVLRFRPDARDDQPAIEAQGVLDDLRGLDDWLAIIFPMERRVAAILAPAGPITLTLSSLSYFPGREPGGPSAGRLDHRSTIRHYDSAFRITPWDLEVRHVHGAMAAGPAGISFGSDGSKEEDRLAGEIWGTEVDLRGTIEAKAAQVVIRLAETELRTSALSAQPSAMAVVWRRLHPSGVISGELGFQSGDDSGGSFRGAFQFRDLSFEEVPLIGPAAGKLSLRGSAASGSGLLEISSATLEPLGKVSGEIPIEWSGGKGSIKSANLALGDGRLLGEMEYDFEKRLLRGSVRFDRAAVGYAGGLLAALRAGGKIDFASGPDGITGQGAVDLEEVSLDLKRLDLKELAGRAETVTFNQGQLLFALTPEGLRPLRLDLRGAGGALRLLGAIGPRGGIDAVAVLAVGDSARSLALLPSSSSPQMWRQAAGEAGLALRLSGSALHPRIRAVEWSDPMFQGSAVSPPAGAPPAGDPPAPLPSNPPAPPGEPAKKG